MPQTRTARSGAASKWRRTKIIATLGPASNTPAMIERLIDAGVNLVRINMSHGDQDTHQTTIRRVRKAAARAGCHIGILMDLCGPKIRVGKFAGDGIQLKKGAQLTVTTRKVTGKDALIPSQYKTLHKDVKRGEKILLDDGKLSLKVLGVEGNDVSCKVVDGGWLSNHKGMNLPDSELSTRALTRKDREDVAFGIEAGVDFVALSFVRGAKDVTLLKQHMKKLGAAIPVISKIERPEAVDTIDEIIHVSDGIMIARGDLGIELPAERVPLIQRDIVSKSRQAGVPVIVATQMLESM
ncbi:MAG: pyruvate kinase, partial [Thiohalobacterales bacterium]|nr:pyruvate kinase [Thiohalobacterales bacterium]